MSLSFYMQLIQLTPMIFRVADEVQSKELPEQGEATDVPNRVFTLLNLFPMLVPREGIIVYDLSWYHLLASTIKVQKISETKPENFGSFEKSASWLHYCCRTGPGLAC